MGKQKQLKKMRREMKKAEILPPPPEMLKVKQLQYVSADEAITMFPDQDPAVIRRITADMIAGGKPGFPVNMPTHVIKDDHSRQIKKAYLRAGYKGVEEYYDRVNQNNMIDQVQIPIDMTAEIADEALPAAAAQDIEETQPETTYRPFKILERIFNHTGAAHVQGNGTPNLI